MIAKDLNENDVLGRLNDHERKFVNDMTKLDMASRYIVVIFKRQRSRKPNERYPCL